MFFRMMIYFIVISLCVGSISEAADNIPDVRDPCVTAVNAGGQPMVLYCLPNGRGNSFAEAQVMGNGTPVDAILMLQISDSNGDPISGFPQEDIWLESTNGGLVPCAGGTTMDSDTDEHGRSQWSEPLHAGGFDSGTCEVIFIGSRLTCPGLPLNLAFNSADINGDGVVNLVDTGLFAGILFGDFDFSADFFSDGVINLADVSRMAVGLGAGCQ